MNKKYSFFKKAGVLALQFSFLLTMAAWQPAPASALRLLGKEGIPLDINILGEIFTSDGLLQLIDASTIDAGLLKTKLAFRVRFIGNSLPQTFVYYRARGTSTYDALLINFQPAGEQEISFKSVDGKDSSRKQKVFSGLAVIPAESVVSSGIEIYVEGITSAGPVRIFSPLQPHFVPVSEEICGLRNLSAAEGQAPSPTALRAGPVNLAIPVGSGFQNGFTVNVCARRPAMLPVNMYPNAASGIRATEPVAWVDLAPSPTTFRKPLKLQIGYIDANRDGIVDDLDVRAKDLKVCWWDPTGLEWRVVGGVVDEENQIVSVDISHFSIYAVFAVNSTTTYRPRERIITPARQDGINDIAQFDGLAGKSFSINIFDLTGRMIRRLDSLTSWDGRNDTGDVVESGPYVYQVHVDGQIISGVVVVAK